MTAKITIFMWMLYCMNIPNIIEENKTILMNSVLEGSVVTKIEWQMLDDAVKHAVFEFNKKKQ